MLRFQGLKIYLGDALDGACWETLHAFRSVKESSGEYRLINRKIWLFHLGIEQGF